MRKNSNWAVITGVVIAALLWFIIFVVRPLNFWASMCMGITLLLLMALILDRTLFQIGKLKPRHILIGILSAAILYGIFYVGNILSTLIIPLKDEQLAGVYTNRAGTNPLVIFAALLLVIGPGEELFWRGFIQKRLTERYGGKAVVIAAVLYAAAHIVTLNFMLIMASLVCGLFWGALYHKEKSLYPVILSHAVWDVTVFILLPFN